MFLLISLQNSFIDLGIRSISSACRSQNIATDVLWLNREHHELLSSKELAALVDWISRSTCVAVGMNVMSLHLSLAKQISSAIKDRIGHPIIWGGVHAILEPEECLNYADYVCVGEGEETIIELIHFIQSGTVLTSLPNFYFKKGSEIIRGERMIISDLDQLPIMDLGMDHHWILQPHGIDPLTETELSDGFPWNHGRHITITSRGCPYNCTYCCSPAMRMLFGKRWVNRFRSVENVMQEIRIILSITSTVHTIAIMDDSFFFKPAGWLEEFCREIKKTGVQFGVLLHPESVTSERIQKLVDAGLIGIQMGLQSGSHRVLKDVFNRTGTVEDFRRAASILDQFKDILHARTYDIIVDNPFETTEDQVDTIRFLMSLSKPFNIDLFSLTLYPGTHLRNVLLHEKSTNPADLEYRNKDFIKYRPTALNRLAYLAHDNPSWFIGFLLFCYRFPFGKHLIACVDTYWEKGLRVMLRKLKHGISQNLLSKQTSI